MERYCAVMYDTGSTTSHFTFSDDLNTEVSGSKEPMDTCCNGVLNTGAESATMKPLDTDSMYKPVSYSYRLSISEFLEIPLQNSAVYILFLVL